LRNRSPNWALTPILRAIGRGLRCPPVSLTRQTGPAGGHLILEYQKSAATRRASLARHCSSKTTKWQSICY